MKLTGQQIQQLQEALLSAFPSKDELRMLVRFALDADLETIAGGENQRVVVFKLLTWAESWDRLADLIDGAARQNHGNAALKQLVQDALGWSELRRVGNQVAGSHPSAVPAVIDIFLSYSRRDAAVMRQLYADLRTAGFSVWIDEGLEPGTPNWKAAIEEAVQQARCMVVLLTPEAKGSPWVNNEIAYAQTLQRLIFPVLAAGDAANAIPLDLINTQRVDVRQSYRRQVEGNLLPALHRLLRPVQVAPSSPLAPARQPPRAAPLSQWRLWWVGALAALLLLLVAVWDLGSRGLFRPPWIAVTPTNAAVALNSPTASNIPPSATATATETSSPTPTDRPALATPTSDATATDAALNALVQTGVAATQAARLPANTATASERPLPTDTAMPPTTPTPDITATAARLRALVETALAATLTAEPPIHTATVTETATPAPTDTLTASNTPTRRPRATPTKTNTPAATPTPLPGATRTNAQDGAVYIWIAAGSFSMGSGAEDTLALDGEKPAHPVDVAGFWIMRKEVTNGQYSRCVAAGACSAPSNDHWQDAGYVEHPVTDVDWQQAKRYAEWAGGRLPTEAEWEYACRGTDGRIYPWGNEPPSHALANYDNSEGTKPVGSYPPGANGLYDMAGNVWEWTSSLSKPYPYIAEDGREDAAASGNRALRGGSWLNGGLVVRCAVRYVFFLDLRGDLVGFRVVSPGL